MASYAWPHGCLTRQQGIDPTDTWHPCTICIAQTAGWVLAALTAPLVSRRIDGFVGFCMGMNPLQSRCGVGIAPSGWRPSLWTRLAPPTETGVVLSRVDQGEQSASYTIRVPRIAVCVGFPPHRRSHTAHADMPIWLSFLEGALGRSHQGWFRRRPTAYRLCTPEPGRRCARCR